MKASILSAFLLLVLFSSCQKPEPVGSSESLRTYDEIAAAAEREGIPLSKLGIKRNWNEVLAIASIYGLQDSFRNVERTNNGLMFDTEDQLHAYFKQTKQTFELRHQGNVYRELGQHIQSLSDYFNLLDSLPLYRRVAKYHSDEEYEALKKKYFASDYKFFINEVPQNNRIAPYLIVVTKPEEMPTEKARQIAKR